MSIVVSPTWRGLVACSIALGLSVGFAVAAQKQDDKQKQASALDQAQRMEAQALVALTDAAMSGQAAGGQLNWTWENNFLKAQDGKTYVPFTIQFDPSVTGPMPATLYVRVVTAGSNTPIPPAPAPAEKGRNERDKDKKAADPKAAAAAAPATYPFEDIHFLEVRQEAVKPTETAKPARISRAFAVSPGEYDVYVAVKERTPASVAQPAAKGGAPAPAAAPAGRMGVAKQTITVPNYWSNEFTTSTVIVADRVENLKEPLTAQQQMERPYAMGTTEIVPAFDLKFSKTETLAVIFLVYNPAVTAGKPDLTVEYTFHQKAADGEKRFNSTDPQNFNAQTLPPTFDFAAGHQLVAGQEIPLATFPPGDFRLEIKITDKVSGKSLMRNLNFTVATS